MSRFNTRIGHVNPRVRTKKPQDLSKVNAAFQTYLSGKLDGWDFLTVVQAHGFTGFRVSEACELSLYK